MARTSLIGASIPRIDAAVKATGKARFASDISFPRMLHGKILRSPLPHARLLNVDTSRAARLAGVKAVVTGRDTAGVKFGFIVVPEGFRDKLALAIDRVRFIGDEIAAVAAVDEETAQEALELIQVDYQELPAVFDPEAAMEPDAPRIHDHAEDNISRKLELEFGDVDEGFRRSAHIREDWFATQATSHVPVETHSAVAVYEPPGRLTIWTSTQSPFYVQDDLSRTLLLLPGDIRVIKPFVGGGFGGKGDGMDSLDFCASLLSMKTGRPVRICYSRDEEFVATRRRHPATIGLKTGVSRDGTILAKESRVVLDGGAYTTQGGMAPHIFATRLSFPYRQGALRYRGYRVYTNKQTSAAMRGYGSPQVHFAQDVQMELIARDLGLDPQEVRLKNGLVTGETTISGAFVPSSGFLDSVIRVKTAMAEAGKQDGKSLRGWGIGCAGYASGTGVRVRPGAQAFSQAEVRAHADGTVTLLTGAADIGQGSDTVLSQIVAEELSLPMESVRIISADTAITPPDLGTYASRVTVMGGNAAWAAARHLKEQLLEATAQTLEASAGDLVMEDGRISVKGTPDRGLSFAEAVAAFHGQSAGRSAAGRGVYNATSIAPPNWVFGTNGSEVEIDRETGQVAVLRVAAAHDCGVAINPLSVEGQVEGAIHMGLGFALTEKMEVGGGQVLNPSLLDYKVPTSLEMPEVDVLHLHVVDPVGPFGAKEIGEGSVGPNGPAIANAIREASGVEMYHLPITPEDMLKALEKRAASTSGEKGAI